MKEELSVAEKEDAAEVKKWRGLSQSEKDQSWKNLAVQSWRKQQIGFLKVEALPLEWREK